MALMASPHGRTTKYVSAAIIIAVLVGLWISMPETDRAFFGGDGAMQLRGKAVDLRSLRGDVGDGSSAAADSLDIDGSALFNARAAGSDIRFDETRAAAGGSAKERAGSNSSADGFKSVSADALGGNSSSSSSKLSAIPAMGGRSGKSVGGLLPSKLSGAVGEKKVSGIAVPAKTRQSKPAVSADGPSRTAATAKPQNYALNARGASPRLAGGLQMPQSFAGGFRNGAAASSAQTGEAVTARKFFGSGPVKANLQTEKQSLESDSQQENRQGGKLVAALKQSDDTSRFAASSNSETESRAKALSAFDKSGGTSGGSMGIGAGVAQTGVGISSLDGRPKNMSATPANRSSHEVFLPPPPSPAQPQESKGGEVGSFDSFLMMMIARIAMGVIFSNDGVFKQQKPPRGGVNSAWGGK